MKHKQVQAIVIAGSFIMAVGLVAILARGQSPVVKVSQSPEPTSQPGDVAYDDTKFTRIAGKVMTYDKAYPLLVADLQSPSVERQKQAVEALLLFGDLLKGKPVITNLIHLYQATPSPVSDTPSTQKESDQLDLKFMILSCVAFSGDPRRGRLLQEAASDHNPMIQDWLKNIQNGLARVSEIPPGSALHQHMLLEPKQPHPDQVRLYLFQRHALTKDAMIVAANQVFSGSDGDAIFSGLQQLAGYPDAIKNSDVVDTLIALFKRADNIEAPKAVAQGVDPKNTVLGIKEQIIDILGQSGDSQANAFLETAQNDADADIRQTAAGYTQ